MTKKTENTTTGPTGDATLEERLARLEAQNAELRKRLEDALVARAGEIDPEALQTALSRITGAFANSLNAQLSYEPPPAHVEVDQTPVAIWNRRSNPLGLPARHWNGKPASGGLAKPLANQDTQRGVVVPGKGHVVVPRWYADEIRKVRAISKAFALGVLVERKVGEQVALDDRSTEKALNKALALATANEKLSNELAAERARVAALEANLASKS